MICSAWEFDRPIKPPGCRLPKALSVNPVLPTTSFTHRYVRNGDYVVRVEASDDRGTTVSTVTVSVNGANTAPGVDVDVGGDETIADAAFVRSITIDDADVGP